MTNSNIIENLINNWKPLTNEYRDMVHGALSYMGIRYANIEQFCKSEKLDDRQATAFKIKICTERNVVKALEAAHDLASLSEEAEKYDYAIHLPELILSYEASIDDYTELDDNNKLLLATSDKSYIIDKYYDEAVRYTVGALYDDENRRESMVRIFGEKIVKDAEFDIFNNSISDEDYERYKRVFKGFTSIEEIKTLTKLDIQKINRLYANRLDDEHDFHLRKSRIRLIRDYIISGNCQLSVINTLREIYSNQLVEFIYEDLAKDKGFSKARIEKVTKILDQAFRTKAKIHNAGLGQEKDTCKFIVRYFLNKDEQYKEERFTEYCIINITRALEKDYAHYVRMHRRVADYFGVKLATEVDRILAKDDKFNSLYSKALKNEEVEVPETSENANNSNQTDIALDTNTITTIKDGDENNFNVGTVKVRDIDSSEKLETLTNIITSSGFNYKSGEFEDRNLAIRLYGLSKTLNGELENKSIIQNCISDKSVIDDMLEACLIEELWALDNDCTKHYSRYMNHMSNPRVTNGFLAILPIVYGYDLSDTVITDYITHNGSLEYIKKHQSSYKRASLKIKSSGKSLNLKLLQNEHFENNPDLSNFNKLLNSTYSSLLDTKAVMNYISNNKYHMCKSLKYFKGWDLVSTLPTWFITVLLRDIYNYKIEQHNPISCDEIIGRAAIRYHLYDIIFTKSLNFSQLFEYLIYILINVNISGAYTVKA